MQGRTTAAVRTHAEMALSMVLLGAAGTGCAGDAAEALASPALASAVRLGESAQALTAFGPEAPVSIPGQSAVSPSAAWIRSSSFLSGQALVGYTADGIAAWSHAVDWTSPSPSWSARRADEPAFAWPAPTNLCKVYDCQNGAAWGAYETVAQALGTGATDVAALVGTGASLGDTAADVILASSTDGGQTFREARILSIATPKGDSGGFIDPETVHASLMYTAARTSGEAGQEPAPIYVVWRSLLEDRRFWMTKVIVGLDGTIAPLRPPTPISVIPEDAEGHASILAFEDDNGDEVVLVAWSERSNAAGQPVGNVPCPSTQTIEVRWYVASTRSFGAPWGTPELVDHDPAWRPCVGTSFAGAGAPPWGRNNDRPELVMNRGAPYMWYVAINRSVSGKEGMRPVVWRLSGGGWQRVFEAPSKHPSTQEPVTDAWGQSIAIVQGRVRWQGHQVFTTGALALAWRASVRGGAITMQVAISVDEMGSTGTWKTADLTEGVGVPWSMTGHPGLYTGVASIELCVDEPCPSGVPANWPDVPFFAAWGDTRGGGASEVWARAFRP